MFPNGTISGRTKVPKCGHRRMNKICSQKGPSADRRYGLKWDHHGKEKMFPNGTISGRTKYSQWDHQRIDIKFPNGIIRGRIKCYPKGAIGRH
jgi:hypothetical protein